MVFNKFESHKKLYKKINCFNANLYFPKYSKHLPPKNFFAMKIFLLFSHKGIKFLFSLMIAMKTQKNNDFVKIPSIFFYIQFNERKKFENKILFSQQVK